MRVNATKENARRYIHGRALLVPGLDPRIGLPEENGSWSMV